MDRNMLKWPGRRKYRLRDTPYAPLVESPDITNADNMKQRFRTNSLLTTRWSDKPKATTGCLGRRTMINNTKSSQCDVNPTSENDSEQSSFVTISSEELRFEDSNSESEHSQHVRRNTFRRFSESSIASVAKMSAKWCKIRDSFVPARRSSFTLPKVVDNTYIKPDTNCVKSDSVMPIKSKNPLEHIKRTNSLLNRKRRWSVFSTGYVKLNNSDSSPSVGFGLENAAHSTSFLESDDQDDKPNYEREFEGSSAVRQEPVRQNIVSNADLGCMRNDKRNSVNEQVSRKKKLLKKKHSATKLKKMKTSAGPDIFSERNMQGIKKKRLQKSIGTTRYPKDRRRDVYSIKTLSVKSSEGKVEVKISLELSDARNEHEESSSTTGYRSHVTNKYYLRSPRKTDITPVLPKRPLSRRSLFSEETGVRDTITNWETEMARYEARCSERNNMWELNTAQNTTENGVHLSPHTGETEDQLLTPPNPQELTLSIKQIPNRPRHVRKLRSFRY